jgi:electron transfer flavoprotein beta subunit
VRAIEITESSVGSVTTITVGEASCDPIIRKALAIGANDAVRINTVPTDSAQVARLIANYADGQGFDAIMCGKETIDHNSSAVPAMIAECLDLPFVAFATSLDMNDGSSSLTCETAGGTNSVKVTGPFVLSAAKGMSEQRIPNMRGIMSARTKPLQVIEADGVQVPTAIEKFTLPPAKGSCVMVDAENTAELVRLLREEAKII